MDPLLRAVNLSRRLGAMSMVQQVSLEIFPGEVLGLAGQSGAGKSALSMLLSGFYTPTEGELYLDGQHLNWPFHARQLGIELIPQQPDIAEKLSISSNVFLGNEVGWQLAGRWLTIPNHRRMESQAASALAELGLHVESTRAPATNLSAEQRQLIAIARVICRATPPKLLIMDNPFPALSYPFQQRVLTLISQWQRAGTAILVDSDNVDHLLAVTDRIVVLRHGRRVAEFRTDETNREEVLAAMVGTTDRQQLTPIIWALDSYYRARERAEKLHQQRALLERDVGTKTVIDQQIFAQMAHQIDALDSTNAALQDAQRRLLTELEQERKRLAREIHDQVIQDMLGVNYHLEEIEASRNLSVDLRDELMTVRSDIRDMVSELRHICGTLRPPTIDSLGLGPALQSFTRDWSKRADIAVILELDPDLSRLPEAIELSVFRIVQEALNNVRKHAGAHQVTVRLMHTSPRGLMLSIADDGRGLPPDFSLAKLSAQGHYGMIGIGERVVLLGGRVNFETQPGGGTLVQVEIPHPRVEQSLPPLNREQ